MILSWCEQICIFSVYFIGLNDLPKSRSKEFYATKYLVHFTISEASPLKKPFKWIEIVFSSQWGIWHMDHSVHIAQSLWLLEHEETAKNVFNSMVHSCEDYAGRRYCSSCESLNSYDRPMLWHGCMSSFFWIQVLNQVWLNTLSNAITWLSASLNETLLSPFLALIRCKR